MRFLKTNTATRVTVGPFLDKTDGITPETAITVTSEKLTLMVDDGGVPTLVLDTAPTASGGANDMVHVTGDDAGFYDLELAAADVNYVGRAMLALTDAATHLPVFHEFMILPAQVYDSLIGGSDLLDVNTSQLGGTAQTGRDVGASVLVGDKTGFSLSAAGIQAIWDALTSALTTVGSIGKLIVDALGTDVQTLLSRLSATRAGYLDKLNITGNVASSNEVTAIQNNTRVVIVVPDVVERPDSGTQSYKVRLYLYDENGNMEAPDSEPTVALVNPAGTDLSARLGAASNPATGQYEWTYTADAAHALEQLLWEFTVVEGGATRKYGRQSLIVDTTAVDFTAADRTKLDTLHDTRLTAGRAAALDEVTAGRMAELDAGNMPADLDTLKARVVGVIQPQTGDAYARLGAPSGVSISADIQTRATPAQVNAEVQDVLNTDTTTEPTSPPAATAALSAKISYLFAKAKNKITQTATQQKLRNDGDSADIATATVADDATTFTKGKDA